MTKRVLVIGKSGQLSRSLQKIAPNYPSFQFQYTGIEELDLLNTNVISGFLEEQGRFDVLINCSAYTAVDKAESESDKANLVNHLAVLELAKFAKLNNIPFIHVSTDYVFDGKSYRPYVETDHVQPANVYGKTKLDGEIAIKQLGGQAAIIRTSWLYSEFGNNFVKTMLRLGRERSELGVIFDQVGTPTYAPDLAMALLSIAQQMLDKGNNTESTQVYHYSNEGVCSWFDFAKTIFDEANIQINVNEIETQDYPTPAARPHYSVLNKTKIKTDFGLRIPYWKASLQVCLAEIEKEYAK